MYLGYDGDLGCCNDVEVMYDIIKSKGFDDDDIKILRDDSSRYEEPSGANVKKALAWLCNGRSTDDVLYMHFSGHVRFASLLLSVLDLSLWYILYCNELLLELDY